MAALCHEALPWVLAQPPQGRAERRGQRGRLGSMQTQLPSREVGLQPSSLPRHDEDLREPLVRPQGSQVSMSLFPNVGSVASHTELSL